MDSFIELPLNVSGDAFREPFQRSQALFSSPTIPAMVSSAAILLYLIYVDKMRRVKLSNNYLISSLGTINFFVK